MKQQSSYYGGFFWISLLSMIVPFFVAWKAFDKLQPHTKPVPTPDVSGVDQELFNYLVKKYVADGLVDYNGLSRDYLFTQYISQINQCDPEKLETEDEKLALYINAYNALVIDGVIKHKIHKNERNVLGFRRAKDKKEIAALEEKLEMAEKQPNADADSIARIKAELAKKKKETEFFELEEHIFAGKTVSLNYLEHKVIRPVFQEPRIHVALVCAAKSCPAIRGEAYFGNRVRDQLEDQAVQFANSETYVKSNPLNNEVYLSPILDWYGEDFDAQGGILEWVAARVGDETLKAKLLAKTTKIKFNEYDWSLNAQAGGSGPAVVAKGGSGSVENE